MIVYLLQRGLQAAATMLVAVALVFIAVRGLPRSPVLARFGQHPVPEQIEAIMRQQGWDRPCSAQLLDFSAALCRGDLGESFMRAGEDVAQELSRRIPATMELALAAMLLATPTGILAGVAAARWQHRLPDHVCMTLALFGVSVPVFFLGICLIQIFSMMPTGNRLPPGTPYDPLTGFVLLDTGLRGDGSTFLSAVRHLCLPAFALSTIPMAIIARVTRSSMLETMSTDYVRTARAKGSSSLRVVWRHAFPNAAIPVTNIAGFQLGMLLTGAVLTETVFSWPGLGRYLMDAVKNSDYAVVQGGALAIAGMFVMLNLALDLVYCWLDPRIRGVT